MTFQPAFSRAFSPAFPQAAGAAAFSPLDVAGCVGWFDGSDIATLYQDAAATVPVTADGDVVGYWGNKAASNHATITVTSRKPLYKVAVKNSRSIVLFDGADDILICSSNVTYAHVWLVWQRATIISSGIVGTTTPGFSRSAGTNAGQGVISDGTSSFVTTASPFGSTVTWYLSQFVRTIPIVRERNIDYAGAGTPAVAFTGAPVIGARFGGGSPYALFYNGRIAEILLYTSSLAAGDVLQIETYLNTKWAVY
jgi:hypothetical protein